MIRFIAIIALFSSHVAFASLNLNEENKFVRFENGIRQIITLRGEDGQVVLEAFTLGKDHWQDFAWRETFATEAEALDRLKVLKAEYIGDREDFVLQGFDSPQPFVQPPLWTASEAWSEAWEKSYAEWVLANADPEFFVKHKIATDCADVAYTMRWIFARIHGLPVAARLAGSGVMITQDTVRSDWMKYPTHKNWSEDRRFRAALNYLMNNTYTHTLLRESYPVEISKQGLLAGSHHLRLSEQTGHTLFIHRTFYDDPAAIPIRVMASTVPRDVRSLYESNYGDSEQPTVKNGGFLRFRWPIRTKNGQTTIVAPEQMPHYSLEQYTPEFMNGESSFSIAVLKHLNPDFSFKKWLEGATIDLKKQIEMRRSIVEEGFKICSVQKCSEGTENYENWSTPSRDKRLRNEIFQIQNTVYSSGEAELVSNWHAALKEEVLELAGVRYTLERIVTTWQLSMFSSDPMVDPDVRWALSPTGFANGASVLLKDVFTKRAKKIVDNKCATVACAFGEGAWYENSSVEFDNSLLLIRSAVRGYCSNASDAECAHFERLKEDTKITFNGITKSLEQWVGDSIWFNPNPLVSVSERWGSHAAMYRSYMFEGFGNPIVAENGWMTLPFESNSSESANLANAITGETISAGDDRVWIRLAKDGSHAVSKAVADNPDEELETTNLEFLNLQTRVSTKVELGEPAIPLTSKTKNVVAIGEKWIQIFDPAQPLSVKKIDKVGDISVSNQFIASINLAEKKGIFVDIENMRSIPVDEALMVEGATLSVQASTENAFVVRNIAADNSFDYVIDRQTGAILQTIEGALTTYYPRSHHTLSLDETQNGRLVKYDTWFNPISIRNVGLTSIRLNAICFSEKLECHRVSDGGIDDKPATVGLNILSIVGDVLLIQESEVNTYVSLLSQPKRALMKASSINRISLDPSWIQVTATNGYLSGVFKFENGQLKNVFTVNGWMREIGDDALIQSGVAFDIGGERIWLRPIP
ncbi:MAG TPA: hypothetical protein VM432_01045 [Bdellovibrionales bacterium]|nr:hypothetical protein [Bdellovibrionales bacterium]